MVSAQKTILVVDDDSVTRRLLVRTLAAVGYACEESENGAEALVRVRNDAPALLLLDYDMPGLNGAEVLKKMRTDPTPGVAQIPTIMLTGHGGEDSEVLCLEAGADDFVTKPIYPAVLRARIETQLRLRSMRDQLLKQNEELEAWRQNLEQDLAAARLTQQSLIPPKPPTLPGWEVAALYRPVIQVGGDIYGWLRLRDGRILFWIAAAALLTTLAKLLFHHASVENDAPAEIMRVVDRDFHSMLGARCFMTAMCVALNPKTGAASIVGAGHPPLLVARFNGKTESIASSSPPLGLVTRSSFTETPLQLIGGDLFLLYTDGLYGSANGAPRRLTPGSLAKRLHSTSGSAESLLRRLCQEALTSGKGDSPADDIAALAVRRHPEGN